MGECFQAVSYFMSEREYPLMVVSLLGLVELARGKSALSGEGERTFGQNSNCRLGDVAGSNDGATHDFKNHQIFGTWILTRLLLMPWHSKYFTYF